MEHELTFPALIKERLSSLELDQKMLQQLLSNVKAISDRAESQYNESCEQAKSVAKMLNRMVGKAEATERKLCSLTEVERQLKVEWEEVRRHWNQTAGGIQRDLTRLLEDTRIELDRLAENFEEKLEQKVVTLLNVVDETCSEARRCLKTTDEDVRKALASAEQAVGKAESKFASKLSDFHSSVEHAHKVNETLQLVMRSHNSRFTDQWESHKKLEAQLDHLQQEAKEQRQFFYLEFANVAKARSDDTNIVRGELSLVTDRLSKEVARINEEIQFKISALSKEVDAFQTRFSAVKAVVVFAFGCVTLIQFVTLVILFRS